MLVRIFACTDHKRFTDFLHELLTFQHLSFSTLLQFIMLIPSDMPLPLCSPRGLFAFPQVPCHVHIIHRVREHFNQIRALSASPRQVGDDSVNPPDNKINLPALERLPAVCVGVFVNSQCHQSKKKKKNSGSSSPPHSGSKFNYLLQILIILVVTRPSRHRTPEKEAQAPKRKRQDTRRGPRETEPTGSSIR